MTGSMKPRILPVLAALEADVTQSMLDRELDMATATGVLSHDEVEALRRIQSSLVRGRRRESLLRVLLETTTDLVAITDFESALQAIVRRTRMLLGSDMAYVSLNDYDSRETYIHTTDGVSTEAYRNIRMELGAGVLGKIAEGTGSTQTLEYVDDTEIIHVDGIDETVQREGVRSIMGAPLMRDGVLLGALLVAERYQRTFTAEELWLVESMSAMACVALSNARLIGEMKSALTERDEFQERLEGEHLRLADEQMFERALVACAVTGDPYSEFLETLGQQNINEAWLLDDAGRPFQGTGTFEPRQQAVSRALSRSRRTGEIERVDVGGIPREDSQASEHLGPTYFVLSVDAATRVLGGILIAGELTADVERLMRRSSMMLSVLRLMDERKREESVKVQAELFRSLLQPTDQLDAFTVQRAARFGIARDKPVFVQVIGASEPALRVLSILRSNGDWGNVLAAEMGGRAVLVSATDLGDRVVSLFDEQQVTVTVGTEAVARFMGSLEIAYRAAESTLLAMQALGLEGRAGNAKDLGVVGLLVSTATPDRIESIIDAGIGPLIAYDLEKQTSLVNTLWVFFQCDRHHVRTAQELHVHPNTLRQRLERIASLVGSDWLTSHRSSMLYLALQLHRLRANA